MNKRVARYVVLGFVLAAAVWSVIALARVHIVWTPMGAVLAPKRSISFRDTYVMAEDWDAKDFARHPRLREALQSVGAGTLLEKHEWEQAYQVAPRLHDLETRLFVISFWLLAVALALYSVHVAWKKPLVGSAASGFTFAAGLILSGALIVRLLDARHAPYSNMYEFLMAFVWSLVIAYVAIEQIALARGVPAKIVGVFVLPIALVLVAWALRLPEQWRAIDRLQPALASSWRVFHVFCGVASYGPGAVAAGVATVSLLRPRLSARFPSVEQLQGLAHQLVQVAFPFLTLLIITGAMWGKQAWGRYWAWDPKEVAALVTWIVYLIYFHARARLRWKGWQTSSLVIAGFVSVLFTLFGVSLLSKYAESLHTYAAP